MAKLRAHYRERHVLLSALRALYLRYLKRLRFGVHVHTEKFFSVKECIHINFSRIVD
jgi:hypothetical protein